MTADDRNDPSFVDKLRAKADELEAVVNEKFTEYRVQERVDDLGEKARGAIDEARVRAGELARDNREKIDDLLDRAAAAAERTTDGKHTDRIRRVRDGADGLVDKVANQPPRDPDKPGASGDDSGATD